MKKLGISSTQYEEIERLVDDLSLRDSFWPSGRWHTGPISRPGDRSTRRAVTLRALTGTL